MLQHFRILQTHANEEDFFSYPFHESLPLIFSSLDALTASKESFEQTIKWNDRILLKSVFCTDRKFDVSNASRTKNSSKYGQYEII